MENTKQTLKLNDDRRKDMLDEIKLFFSNERNEDLGDLAAGIILDFILEKLANEFYNQGINDARRYLSDRVDEVLNLQKLN